jgi:hypothetical protein
MNPSIARKWNFMVRHGYPPRILIWCVLNQVTLDDSKLYCPQLEGGHILVHNHQIKMEKSLWMITWIVEMEKKKKSSWTTQRNCMENLSPRAVGEPHFQALQRSKYWVLVTVPLMYREGPKYRPFRDLTSVPEPGRPREHVENYGRACTQVRFLWEADLGFFHFSEIVRGWLVPSAG